MINIVISIAILVIIQTQRDLRESMPQPPWAASSTSFQGPLQASIGVPSEQKRDSRWWEGGWVEGGHEGDVAVEVILAQQARKLLRNHLQHQCPLVLYLNLNSKPSWHRRQWGRDQSQWQRIQWDWLLLQAPNQCLWSQKWSGGERERGRY